MTTIIPFTPLGTSAAVLPFLRPAASNPAVCELPLLRHRISAGFPSPADEYIEKGLDLNTYLVRNKNRDFFLPGEW